MIPVFGRIKHEPPVMGDCFRACVASILELDYDQVPHFLQGEDGYNPLWFTDFEKWLRPMGLEPVLLGGVDCANPDSNTAYFGYGYHIVTGKSPRFSEGEVLHSVVHRDTKLVHDPFPGGTGVKTIVDFLVFVSVDPAKVARLYGAPLF